MKKILGIVLACLLVGLVAALVSTSVFATTAQGNAVLKSPFMRLWNSIHNLQSQLSNIELIPGPEGPPGITGPAGECSCTGEVSLAEFQSLAARVESLEGNYLLDCIIDSDCDDNDPCTDEICDALLGCVYTDSGSGVCSGSPDDEPDLGTPGALVITEVMYNPDAVTDTYGEWFEIYHAGDAAISLNGWQITDYGTDSFVIQEELAIQPGESLVLCKNNDMSLNGGVGCDYKYSSFTLGNTNDAIVLKNPEGQIIDEVAYDAGIEPWKSLNNAGYSLQLDPASYDVDENDDGASWCNAYDVFGNGDLGTPGAMNSDCNTG